MQFTTERPLAEQLVESIVENPEEWSRHTSYRIVHTSGIQLRIRYQGNSYLASIEKPETEDITFTEEEHELLSKWIKKRLEDIKAENAAAETQKIVAAFNRSQEPPRDWNVVGPDDTDPITYFSCTAKYCIFIAALSIVMFAGLVIFSA